MIQQRNANPNNPNGDSSKDTNGKTNTTSRTTFIIAIILAVMVIASSAATVISSYTGIPDRISPASRPHSPPPISNASTTRPGKPTETISSPWREHDQAIKSMTRATVS